MKKLTILCFAIFWMISNINANDDLSRLKLLFVGDVMGHSPQIKSAYNATTQTYNYTPCFKFVKPIIEEADLAIGNLEVTLSDQVTYTGYPMFRSPDALAEALKTAGFDILVTSNNHSNDNGVYGVTHTIDVLEKQGFYHTGTFKNQAEKDLYYPLIVYKNDFRLAFLNYTYGTNGLSTKEPTVVNLIDEATIKADIAFAEQLKPDAIIMVMHWGAEYQLNESKVQYDLAQKMFEWGVNLVIGSHPHVIQPIKKVAFTNKNGEAQTGLTVFSMGNFISNQQQTNTDGGLMVEIELTKEKGSNKAKIGDCQYIPVWRYLDKTDAKKPYGTYYVLPISAFEAGETTDLRLTNSAKTAMKSFGARMRTHLSKHEGIERTVTMAELGLDVLDGKNIAKGITEIDTTKPRMITPIDDNRYIIYDGNIEVTPPPVIIPQISTKPADYQNPPSGSTGKSGEVIPTPPTKPNNITNMPSIESNGEMDKYLIQIQSAMSLYSEGLPFNNVIVKESRSGLFKYFLAAGNSLTDAKAILEEVQNTGFEDAYIVFNKLEETAGRDIPSEYGTEKGSENKVYKVQFGSSEKYVVPQNLPVNDLEILEHEGRFRYYAGSANDLTGAMELLKTIQAAGYSDAFVVTFVNGKPKQ
jgi:poly-gamma-glutamate synthesis protein (capsule biosynthesis protein)